MDKKTTEHLLNVICISLLQWLVLGFKFGYTSNFLFQQFFIVLFFSYPIWLVIKFFINRTIK